MIRKKILLLSMIILLISGCEDNRGHFRVKVVSPYRQPVEGATIEGGIDWQHFQVQTDSRGITILPGFALMYDAFIYKTNFFPKYVPLALSAHTIISYTYIIEPTPKQFRLIGSVEGWSILFDSGTLVTVDYQGGYHVYSYSDQGITEIASAQIPGTIKDTQLHGDTFWFSTHSDGIYVYSLADPLNPQQLFHLDIPGYLGSFALKNEIIVVGHPSYKETLRIYSYNTSGECQEIASFGNYLVRKMAFISDYLVVVNYYDNLPAVFDLQDPSNPYLVYNGVEPDYWHGFLYKNYLVLVPKPDLVEEQTNYKLIDLPDYKLIDLSDPTNPTTNGFFSADSQLFKIINDSTAMGRYHVWSGGISVLSGNITQGFKTVAISTDNPFHPFFLLGFHEFEGCAPPYFIIGEQLWKLEDR